LTTQDGTGRHFGKPLNHDIPATVWPILMKFDVMTCIGTPYATKHLKSQFSKSQDFGEPPS